METTSNKDKFNALLARLVETMEDQEFGSDMGDVPPEEQERIVG